MANTKITSANLDTLTTLVVDDITIDGSTISDSGDLTLDVGGDIILDADGGEIQLKDGGTEFGQLVKSGNDFRINQAIQDGDIVFRGNDGGSIITALTIDMSDGGKAIFGSAAQFASDISIEAASGNPSITIKTAGTGNNPHINYRAGDNTIFDNTAVFSTATDFWRVGYGSSGTVTNNLLTVDVNGKVHTGTSIGNSTYSGLFNGVANLGASGAIIQIRNGDGKKQIMLRGDNNVEYGSIGLSTVTGAASLQIQGETDIIFNTATDTERLKINATGLDVAGIIDNTRDNGNVAPPNNSDHTAGTRIKFYDGDANTWYAIGIDGNTMWFKADDEFAWYDGAANAVKMKLDANGDLQRPYGIYARGFWNFGGTGSVNSGTTAIYNNNNRITISSGKIYVPVAGRYLVHVQGLDNSSNTSFDTRIQHNVTGSNDAFLADLRLGTNGGGTHGSSSATSIVDMAANDYIHILRLSGNQYASASSTSPHNSWFITYLG